MDTETIPEEVDSPGMEGPESCCVQEETEMPCSEEPPLQMADIDEIVFEEESK